MKLNSWRGTGSDGDVLLTPYVPEGITGYDDEIQYCGNKKVIRIFFKSHSIKMQKHPNM